MSGLIDPIAGTWDEQLVNDVFWEEDVALIYWQFLLDLTMMIWWLGILILKENLR